MLPVKATLDGNIEEMWIEMGSSVHGRHHFTVTDADDIPSLVQAINKATFRKAFVLSYEPPAGLFARISLNEGEGRYISIQVTKGYDKKLRYLFYNGQEDFAVYNGKEITSAIQTILDEF